MCDVHVYDVTPKPVLCVLHFAIAWIPVVLHNVTLLLSSKLHSRNTQQVCAKCWNDGVMCLFIVYLYLVGLIITFNGRHFSICCIACTTAMKYFLMWTSTFRQSAYNSFALRWFFCVCTHIICFDANLSFELRNYAIKYLQSTDSVR